MSGEAAQTNLLSVDPGAAGGSKVSPSALM